MSGGERIEEVGFEVEGERCAAWLHLPKGPGPHPGVVLLHSTAGVRQMPCYAERGGAFAAAGISVLNFDCRGFGGSDGQPRQLFDVARQAADLTAAIAFVRRLPELDTSRLGLWGGSAGCGVVLAAAAREGDLRAVVCLTPFIPGTETQRSAHTPILRLAAAAFADRVRMALGREPRGVAVSGEPDSAAILVAEDAAVRERALGEGTAWENRVVLRPRLRTPSPLRVVHRVTAPVLIVAGVDDLLCPIGPAEKLAELAPRGRLESLPCGHFDLYEGASIAAEAHFLHRTLVG